MDKGKKKKSEKKKKGQQQEGTFLGGKTAIINGISADKQNTTEENLNTESGKSNEQTIPESKTQKVMSNDKKIKKVKAKKPKKTSFISSFFSIKRLFLFYILLVFFWCNGKTRKQCNSYEEVLCFNGISQYILNHDFFHKYIEPTVIVVKQNVDIYGKQALNVASVNYETHARPYVDPFLESAQPHLQTVRELSIEYVYIPVTEGLIKVQEYYDDNAKEHVDGYYNRAVKFSAPYVSQAKERASYAYEQALKYNKNTVQPWYHKKVVTFKDKATSYYDTKLVPFAYRILEAVIETYNEKVVPAYHNHVEPRILAILKLVQSGDKSKAEIEKEEVEKKARVEAEKKAKEEAERKARAEAEKKAKEESERKAKAEAEKKGKEASERKAKAEAEKAKEEAERKAKAEAERKSKEAERKAKAEAERKSKEEAERKARIEAEKKAKEAAETAAIAANKAVQDAFDKEFPLLRKNVTLAISDYERKATSVAQETLREVDDRIATLKNSGSEYLSELKKLVEQVKKDSTKDRSTKFSEITDFAKKSIDNIKENSLNFIELSKKSFSDLEGKKFDQLKKEITVNLMTQIGETRKGIYEQAGNIRVDNQLTTSIENASNSLFVESNGDKNSASLRVRKIFDIINNKIGLLDSTKDEIIKDIHSYVKTEKETLKAEATVRKIEKDDKNSDAIQDNQIPVQIEKSSVEDKDSDVPPVTIQASNDPVLEKLKARQDPVLDKLRKGYELFKIEKGNEPTVQVQSDDDDDDDEGYYDDEETDSGECSS